MNIFYLHEDARTAAQMHNDKHCVKMIVEYAQLLSTAHRVLDGEEYYDRTANNRRIKRWRMDDQIMENGLMKASHVNHPSNKWLRKSVGNYEWLFNLWIELLGEYTHRYRKIHKCFERYDYLKNPPQNIPDKPFTFSFDDLAMPDDVKHSDPIQAYRDYYVQYKERMAKWTDRSVPDWYNTITV
jgi:hypothetical protein